MIVIIGGPQLAHALRKRFASNRSVALFSESGAFRAANEILTRRPRLIALDPAVVATPRGATLVARVRADAELATIDLRVLRIVERVTFGPERRFDIPAPTPVLDESESAIEEAVRSVSDPLAWSGIRRAARFALSPDAPAALNGEATQLVNLSATGVQLVSPSCLRPAETFHLTLRHQEGETRLQAIVAWCALQESSGVAGYRTGAEFLESDQAAIEAYCQLYGRNFERIENVGRLPLLPELTLPVLPGAQTS